MPTMRGDPFREIKQHPHPSPSRWIPIAEMIGGDDNERRVQCLMKEVVTSCPNIESVLFYMINHYDWDPSTVSQLTRVEAINYMLFFASDEVIGELHEDHSLLTQELQISTGHEEVKRWRSRLKKGQESSCLSIRDLWKIFNYLVDERSDTFTPKERKTEFQDIANRAGKQEMWLSWYSFENFNGGLTIRTPLYLPNMKIDQKVQKIVALCLHRLGRILIKILGIYEVKGEISRELLSSMRVHRMIEAMVTETLFNITKSPIEDDIPRSIKSWHVALCVEKLVDMLTS